MVKKKIAIWAPLRYANYGDDMQAIAFAKFLQRLEYDVKLFQLDKELARPWMNYAEMSIW